MPAKPKSVKAAKRSPIAAMCDELGDLEEALRPHRAKLAREKLVREALRHHFDTAPAADSQTVDGTRFAVLLGPRSSESSINVPEAARLIGTKPFLAIASVTLKALSAFPAVLPFVVSTALTGSRSIKVFEKVVSHEK
jgi:hypothetical protein